MSDIKQALARVVSGDPEALAGFGLERRFSTGLLAVSSGVFEWDQRLQLSGRGIARHTVFRSLGDRGGDPAGVYQCMLDPAVIIALAAEALSSGVLDYDPGHIEPGDLMIRIRFAIQGILHEVFLSMDVTPEEDSIRNFLRSLARVEQMIRKHPLRLLRLTAELQGPAPKAGGRRRVPLLLGLHNEGTQGHWVRNPAAMVPDGVLERRYVTWAQKPDERPGETPLPPSFLLGALEPADRKDEEPAVLWIPPQSSVTVPSSAIVHFAEPGAYYFKAAYTSYEGEQQYENAPRWVGAVFSEAQTIHVL